MKVLLHLSCLFGLILAIQGTFTKEQALVAQQHLDACGKELNVDVSSLRQAVKPDISIVRKPEYKCIAKCMLQKYELLDASGKFEVEKVKGKLSDMSADVHEKIKSCVSEHNEEDLCTKYLEIWICFTGKMS